MLVPGTPGWEQDKPDYRGPSLVLSFACRPSEI